MGKTLQRIIKMRIIIALKCRRYLDEDQHEFREGRSIITSLISMKQHIHDILSDNKYYALVSLEIEGDLI